MEKVLVIVDMEGCIGIYDLKNEDYCRDRMEKETSCIIEYLSKQKNCEITVADSHQDGNTISRLKEYYPHVKILSFFWNVKDVESYNYALLIGFHAMQGMDGILSHTLRPEIKEMYMGESLCGEVSLIINWLAYYGVKTIFISGDRELKNEIRMNNSYFFETKSCDDLQYLKDLQFDARYDELTALLERAWENRKVIEQKKYNPREIRIVFFQENILSLLPSSIYQITENKIFFTDTKIFIDELYVLCQYINIAHIWYWTQVKEIESIIRKVYPQKEDFMAKEKESIELLKMPYQEYALEDIKKLSKRMKQIEREHLES